MDASHIHLMLNHIPILGSFFGAILLLIGILLKNRTVEITAMATLLAVSLITIPVFLSGEESEEKVENIANISEHELEEHEEHAELTLWLMLAAGAFSLITLFSFKYAPTLVSKSRLMAVLIAFFAFFSAIPLALHGGKIIHSELRSVNPPAQVVKEIEED